MIGSITISVKYVYLLNETSREDKGVGFIVMYHVTMGKYVW